MPHKRQKLFHTPNILTNNRRGLYKRIKQLKLTEPEHDHLHAETNYLHHLIQKNKQQQFQLYITTTPV